MPATTITMMPKMVPITQKLMIPVRVLLHPVGLVRHEGQDYRRAKDGRSLALTVQHHRDEEQAEISHRIKEELLRLAVAR